MDIQSPIALRITYSLIENDVPVLKPGDPFPSLDEMPLLVQDQTETTFFAYFQKECADDVCKSQVRVNAEFMLPKTRGKFEHVYDLKCNEHRVVF